MKANISNPFLLLALLLGVLFLSSFTARAGYVVLCAETTRSDPEWNKVVEALREKHDAEVIMYGGDINDALPALRARFPRFACFVMPPEEATKLRVAEIHQLTRRLDNDPYTDVIWGILTGFEAGNALWIARQKEPLEIKKVGSGTELAMDMVVEGRWYCELNAEKAVFKDPRGAPATNKVPRDTTFALADLLNDYQADLFVTSGHATERDWQIGYRYTNGYFRCVPGQLFAMDVTGRRKDIRSTNPKVYLPIGNCLMGHIDSTSAMALAWMNSAGVCQMIGYTVPTWYGYMGWGMLDYFVEQPGRFTMAEAFFASQQALLNRLGTGFPELMSAEVKPGGRVRPVEPSPRGKKMGLRPQDGAGLLFDRDTVAFYGDPAWQARMAPMKESLYFEQSLAQENDGVYSFTITPLKGAASFDTVNPNGSQRGGRPFFALLPKRIAPAEIIEGTELAPVITDSFILVPHPGKCDPAQTYRVRFRAAAL